MPPFLRPSLRAVMRAYSPDGILIVDPDERIAYANKSACRMFGGKLKGTGLSDLLPARSRAAHHVFVTAFLLKPETRIMGPNREVWARHFDGSEFLCEIGLVPLRGGRAAAVIREVGLRPGPLNPMT